MKPTVALMIGLSLATPASANDSVAGIGVGGLELRQSDAIAMLSEDLYISPDQVRVRYVFRNESETPVRTLVAFPLPELGLAIDGGDLNLPDPTSANFVQFQTFVDGQPVDLHVQLRVMLDGADRTEALAALGVAPEPFDYWTVRDRMDLLPAQTITSLREGGYLDAQGLPRWTLQSTFYREQVFAPGAEVVVEHRYVPAAAASVDSVFPGPEDLSGFEPTYQAYIAEESARYCADGATLDAMRAQLRGETGLSGFSTFLSAQVDYILTTGANWRGPIGKFHLTVEAPGRWDFAFLCLDGVQRVASSRLEFSARDFTPPHDLSAYFALARGEGIDRQP